jgi:hypothetical protein
MILAQGGSRSFVGFAGIGSRSRGSDGLATCGALVNYFNLTSKVVALP